MATFARPELSESVGTHNSYDASSALFANTNMENFSTLSHNAGDSAGLLHKACAGGDTSNPNDQKGLPELPETYQPQFNETEMIDGASMTTEQAQEALTAVNEIMNTSAEYTAGITSRKSAVNLVNSVMNGFNYNVDLSIGEGSRCGYGSQASVHFPGPDNMDNLSMRRGREPVIMGRDHEGRPVWVPLSTVQRHLQSVVDENKGI